MRRKKDKTVLGPYATEKEAELYKRYAEVNGTHKATIKRRIFWVLEIEEAATTSPPPPRP